jgi:hypothetical protein
MNQELQTLAWKYTTSGRGPNGSPAKMSAARQQLKIKMVRKFGHKQTKQAIKNAFEIAELVGLS